MKFEGVSWNLNSYRIQIASGLTEQQFVSRGILEGKYRQFGENQTRMLREAWRLINSLL